MADGDDPIEIAPPDAEAARLWGEVGRLAAHVLPTGWTLVGGLMVQLHAFEAGEVAVRTTTDIDILGDARRRVEFRALVRALRDDGFELDLPSPVDPTGHRWRRGERRRRASGVRNSPTGCSSSRGAEAAPTAI